MKTNADFILFAVKQAKEAEAFGFTRNHCCRNLKTALLQYWQNKTLGLHNTAQKKKIPRSKAAMKKPLRECRVEHAVPFTVIINYLMDTKNLTAKAVSKVLKNWYSVMLVTYDEDRRLLKSGLRFKMPDNWDKKDIFARYKAVGIKVNY
jgi:hypothetical protein